MITRERQAPYRPEEEILKGIEQSGGWVNAHAHLDRAYSITPESYELSKRPLAEKWEIVDDLKKTSTVGDIYTRMARGTELMISQGVQAVGSFIDIDPVIKDKAMKAADMVRSEYGDQIKLVFINQVLKGVIDPEARMWFEYGATFVDIIGGLPKKDVGRETDHLDTILQIAKSLGKLVHVHVDQYNDPEEYETSLLAERTITHGMQGRVKGIHLVSAAAHSKSERKQIYELMKEAGIGVVTCPSAWIDSRRSETMAVTHNSIAPVEELLEEGIEVALGTDNIYDVYKPFSDGDLWSELRLLLDTCGLRDPQTLIKIATENGLAALGIQKPAQSLSIDPFEELRIAG